MDPLFVASCSLFYSVKCFIAVWIFFCTSNIAAFKITLSASLIFVHFFVSSYSEICTALSTIFNPFKFYCCKSKSIKNSTVLFYFLQLHWDFSVVVHVMLWQTWLALSFVIVGISFFLPYFPFNTINLLLIFHRNSRLYKGKDFNCCVSDSFNWANGDVLVFRPKVCYCNTFKGRCCSK